MCLVEQLILLTYQVGYFKSQSIFREFLEAIDFAQVQLLDDTMTSIISSLTEQSQHSISIRDGHRNPVKYFIGLAHQMRHETEEEPRRVIYPTLKPEQWSPIPRFEARCLQTVEVVAPTVSTVMFKQRMSAYKTIDRPIYIPEDT